MNRKRIQRLMRKLRLRALSPKPRTSEAGNGHKIYSYLLRGLSIERPNQEWASDICSTSIAKVFMYLIVVMDWYSLRVLAWRVSNTPAIAPCVAALEEALLRYATPSISNTDQGAQYTSEAFTAVLKGQGV